MNVERSVGKAGVHTVNFAFDRGQLAGQIVYLHLGLLNAFVLPSFDSREKPFHPIIRNGDELRIALNFICKRFLTNEAAVVAPLLLVLVRAAVVVVTATTLLQMALAGYAVAARAALGEIEECESFFAAMLARLSNLHERRLNFVEHLFGNHRNMHSLVHLSFVKENAIVERIAQQASDGRKREWLFAQIADDACRDHFFLNGCERVVAGGKKLHYALRFLEELGMRLDCAELRFVVIS